MGGERKERRGKRKEGRREKEVKKGRKEDKRGKDRQTDQSLLICETQPNNLNTYIGVFEGAKKEEARYNV